MKVDEYKKQAELNANKSAAEFIVNDFILTATGCGKDVNFSDFIDAREKWNMGSVGRLCQIVDIIDVDEEYEFLEGWLGRPAPTHKGGSQSNDIDESRDQFSLTADDYATFYDLITVYRKPSGKWIGVDCQGYDYWRYVHLPTNYVSLFADERKAALDMIKQRELKRAAEKMEELIQHAKALEERENELKIKYPELTLSPSNGRSVGGNIRKFLAKEFPGIKFKVSVSRSYWGGSFDVNVDVIGVSDQDVKEYIRQVCKVWTDTMPTGRMTDFNDYKGQCESHRCPMAIFGIINNSISFIFSEA